MFAFPSLRSPVRLRLLLDSTAARWLRSLFVRSGNIFIMMPQGPAVSAQCCIVYVDNLCARNDKCFNARKLVNECTRAHSATQLRLCLYIYKKIFSSFIYCYLQVLYAYCTQVVSIESNYCHIQLFLSVYYTYRIIANDSSNNSSSTTSNNFMHPKLVDVERGRERDRGREIRYNIFKQLISIPSNYPIVSVVERACDLCHLKYYNKALNSASAEAKPK